MMTASLWIAMSKTSISSGIATGTSPTWPCAAFNASINSLILTGFVLSRFCVSLVWLLRRLGNGFGYARGCQFRNPGAGKRHSLTPYALQSLAHTLGHGSNAVIVDALAVVGAHAAVVVAHDGVATWSIGIQKTAGDKNILRIIGGLDGAVITIEGIQIELNKEKDDKRQ